MRRTSRWCFTVAKRAPAMKSGWISSSTEGNVNGAVPLIVPLVNRLLRSFQSINVRRQIAHPIQNKLVTKNRQYREPFTPPLFAENQAKNPRSSLIINPLDHSGFVRVGSSQLTDNEGFDRMASIGFVRALLSPRLWPDHGSARVLPAPDLGSYEKRKAGKMPALPD